MSLIGEGRAAVATVVQEQQQALVDARTAAISPLLGNITTQLSAPEFTGDPEIALVHYMGAEKAFDPATDVNPYMELVKKIKEQPTFDDVPVLVVPKHFGEHSDGTAQTTLIRVSPKRVDFKSSKTREENVAMDYGQNTAGVTRSEIAIEGDVLKKRGHFLFDTPPLVSQDIHSTSFPLGSSAVADDKYGKDSSHYSKFQDHDENIFEAEAHDILVGWSEIQGFLLKSLIGTENDGEALQIALRIKGYFAEIGDTTNLLQHMPEVDHAIQAATHFQQFMDSLIVGAE